MEKDRETIEKPGCILKIEHRVRQPDNREETSIQIIPNGGWRLHGSSYNQVIKVSAKDLFDAIDDSNMSDEMKDEVKRGIERGEAK